MPWPSPSAWPEQAAIIYYVSGEPPRCRRNAQKCCNNGTRPNRIDRNVDHREYGELHAYHTDYAPGSTLIIHFARNVRGVRLTREKLMRHYTVLANRSLETV